MVKRILFSSSQLMYTTQGSSLMFSFESNYQTKQVGMNFLPYTMSLYVEQLEQKCPFFSLLV